MFTLCNAILSGVKNENRLSEYIVKDNKGVGRAGSKIGDEDDKRMEGWK